ncbi:hypothetical protein ACYJ1Y_16480 [Natrialbaceae archaeon A-gly3]
MADDGSTDVKHTSADLSATYDYFEYDTPSIAPDFGDGGYVILTDTTDVHDRLEHDELISTVESVNFDDSYVVVSRNQTQGPVDGVVVDAVKQTPDGLQFDVHFHKHNPFSETSVEVVVIAVRGADPPESATVEWFEPFRCTGRGSGYPPYSRLPEPVKREVDVALEDSEYETDGPLLYPLAVEETATLWNGNDYYEPRIDEREETTALRFEPTREYRDSPPEITLVNYREKPLEVTVAVTDDGETLAEADLEIEPEDTEIPADHYLDHAGENGESFETDVREFGEYALSIRTGNGETVAEPFSLDPQRGNRKVLFVEDDDGPALEVYSDHYIDNTMESKQTGNCVSVGGWWGYGGEGGASGDRVRRR